MSDKNNFPPFQSDKPLVLTPWPNGGWTVESRVGDALMPQRLGSFSNAAEMLAALSDDLIHAPAPEQDVHDE